MTADKDKVPDHYKSGYLHWNLVIATGMGYLEGVATKYVARWRKKDGLQDLNKAVHYLEKLTEVFLAESAQTTLALMECPNPKLSQFDIRTRVMIQVDLFAQANHLYPEERSFIEELATWQDEDDLIRTKQILQTILRLPEANPVPVSDSNKHAERA